MAQDALIIALSGVTAFCFVAVLAVLVRDAIVEVRHPRCGEKAPAGAN